MSHGICPGCRQPENDCECVAYTEKVNHPSHYTAFPLEVIDIIKLCLDEIDRLKLPLTSFQKACFKDEIKYRFRAGLKGYDDSDIARDIRKALKYMEFRNDANRQA